VPFLPITAIVMKFEPNVLVKDRNVKLINVNNFILNEFVSNNSNKEERQTLQRKTTTTNQQRNVFTLQDE
jgi:hypothetical protein